MIPVQIKPGEVIVRMEILYGNARPLQLLPFSTAARSRTGEGPALKYVVSTPGPLLRGGVVFCSGVLIVLNNTLPCFFADLWHAGVIEPALFRRMQHQPMSPSHGICPVSVQLEWSSALTAVPIVFSI